LNPNLTLGTLPNQSTPAPVQAAHFTSLRPPVLQISLVIAESGRGCERGRQEPEGPCRGAHVQEGAAIEELKQLREDIDNMSGEHEARKSKYDQINAGFESNWSQLEAVRYNSIPDDFEPQKVR